MTLRFLSQGFHIMNMNSEDYIGNTAQLNGVYLETLSEGKASNMKCYRIYTESGISMLVMLDRGMDIGELKIKGQNISFMSSTGLVNSTYFVENSVKGFMNNFNVGFLTTGGLSYTGQSESKENGLHGVISNTPAENYSYSILGDKIVIQGLIRESRMFGHNLILKRKLTIFKNMNRIDIDDRIVNKSDVKSSMMVLYHTNFGYPFFSPDSKLEMHPVCSSNRDYSLAKDWDQFHEPEPNKEESVYFHEFDAAKNSEIKLSSPLTHLKLRLKFDSNVLPIINQWKLERTKNYVLGLEPSTNDVNGPEMAKRKELMQFLEPNEEKLFHIEYEFSKMEDY